MSRKAKSHQQSALPQLLVDVLLQRRGRRRSEWWLVSGWNVRLWLYPNAGSIALWVTKGSHIDAFRTTVHGVWPGISRTRDNLIRLDRPDYFRTLGVRFGVHHVDT